MLIIGIFKYSIELEEALSEIESIGIYKKHIMVVPMDNIPASSNLSEDKSHNSYFRGIEIGTACATACSVVGTSIGFSLKWGPIIWGLVYGFIGFFIGFGLWFLFNKKTRGKYKKGDSEVTVIVQCTANESVDVIKRMSIYGALNVGRVQG